MLRLAPSPRRKRLPKRVWLAFFATALAAVGLFVCLARFTRVQPWPGFEVPDDVRASQAALLEKLAGPRYFQLGEVEKGVPFPCLSVKSALAQVPGIMAARQMPAADSARIQALIQRLTRPASSRLIGLDFVNVLQLNLALDELP